MPSESVAQVAVVGAVRRNSKRLQLKILLVYENYMVFFLDDIYIRDWQLHAATWLLWHARTKRHAHV